MATSDLRSAPRPSLPQCVAITFLNRILARICHFQSSRRTPPRFQTKSLCDWLRRTWVSCCSTCSGWVWGFCYPWNPKY